MITGSTKLLGLFGCPVSHSHSPFIHNHVAKNLGLDLAYVPFHVDPENLGSAVTGAKALSVFGFNVTVPHKGAIIPFLDSLSESAKEIGAVNTVYREDGDLVGTNTDYLGFARSLTVAGFQPEGKTALLLGAGGSARSVVYALAQQSIKTIIFYARTEARAHAIVEKFARLFPQVTFQVLPFVTALVKEHLFSCDLVVNTTPLGLRPDDPLPIPSDSSFNPSTFVVDLLYNPPLSPFLKLAKSQGCTVLNGWPMLVYQAFESFSIWTGVTPGEEFKPSSFQLLLAEHNARHNILADMYPSDRPSSTSNADRLRAYAQTNNIYILGFMGAGKTTFGRYLGEQLNLPFIDTDQLIETRAGKTINRIFQERGEQPFRLLETEVIFNNVPWHGHVVALGGGSYTQPNIREFCKSTGTTVWLNVPFDEIEQRLKGDETRPLFSSIDDARRLYSHRLNCYREADVELDGTASPETLYQNIIETFSK